jgi:hypothetical protein
MPLHQHNTQPCPNPVSNPSELWPVQRTIKRIIWAGLISEGGNARHGARSCFEKGSKSTKYLEESRSGTRELFERLWRLSGLWNHSAL